MAKILGSLLSILLKNLSALSFYHCSSEEMKCDLRGSCDLVDPCDLGGPGSPGGQGGEDYRPI